MRRIYILFAFCIIPILAFSQTIDFTKVNKKTECPIGWRVSEGNCTMDQNVTLSGTPSLKVDGHQAFVYSMQPLKYEASNITFTGNVRVQDFRGEATVQVYSLGGRNLNSDKNFIGSYRFVADNDNADWQQFNINVPLCKEITHISFVVFLNGYGTLWLDNPVILFDGKPASETPKRSVSKVKHLAERDKRFKKGSNIAFAEPLTPQQIENITLLSRVWGLMKYYHPAVRGGNCNWDNEFFTILPEVADKNSAERNEILYKWVESLGETTMAEGATVPQAVEWIYNTKELGVELSGSLGRVVMSERQPYSYYVSQSPFIGTMHPQHEDRYKKMDFSDDGMKMLAVARYWTFVEYFYPYKDLLEDWNAILSASLADIVNVNDKQGYYESLSRMVKNMGNSHCWVNSRNFMEIFKRERSDIYAALFVSEKYSDGAFWVTYSFGEDENDLRKGDAILAIDGLCVDDYVTKRGKLRSFANYNTFASSIAFNIAQRKGKGTITYTIEREGDTLNVEVKTYPVSQYLKKGRASGIRERSLHSYKGTPLYNYSIIRDSILYISTELTNDNDLQLLKQKVNDFSNIIIDFRNDIKSQNFLLFISDFISGVECPTKIIVADQSNPGQFIIREGNHHGSGRELPNTNIVLLVDETNQSHFEYCPMVLQTASNVTTIGSRTSGADGNVTRIDLPGNYIAALGSIGILYPDMGQTENIGIRLDEEVPLTLSSFRAGSDSVIERAVEILNE